ncbi:MAG: DUF3046 domain-containing protein [Dermatophilaceae bacterium]
MRHSKFWELMAEEFGETYAESLASSLVLSALGGRTAREALDAGIPPREVWVALCDSMDVPEPRRHGREPRGQRTAHEE